MLKHPGACTVSGLEGKKAWDPSLEMACSGSLPQLAAQLLLKLFRGSLPIAHDLQSQKQVFLLRSAPHSHAWTYHVKASVFSRSADRFLISQGNRFEPVQGLRSISKATGTWSPLQMFQLMQASPQCPKRKRPAVLRGGLHKLSNLVCRLSEAMYIITFPSPPRTPAPREVLTGNGAQSVQMKYVDQQNGHKQSATQAALTSRSITKASLEVSAHSGTQASGTGMLHFYTAEKPANAEIR